jgi:histidinol-phosphate aminotransferase
MRIRKLVKSSVRSLNAYHAEEIPCKIKLDANESPYGLRVLGTVKTNRYPDPEARELRRLMARDLKVRAGNILHGNGSDELIYYLVTAFGGPVLYPVPTFSMYGIISQALGERKIEVPLDKDFDLGIDRVLKKIKSKKPKLTFLSSPNNPTGNSFTPEKIKKIIKRSMGLVIIDEAYQQFSGKKSFVPLIKKHDNLIVLRTLSKIGLAGLRAGFMVAGEEIINEVNKVRLPFNLNSLSQKVAIDALNNRTRIKKFIQSIISERRKLQRELEDIDGVEPYPSDANFILFRVENGNRIYSGLLQKGVLIRNMHGVAEGFLRVTVGTSRENNLFIKNLKQLL